VFGGLDAADPDAGGVKQSARSAMLAAAKPA
jgi:hypothetical protein